MPETQKAFAAGDLSESRVKVLAQAQALCPEQFAQDEKRLVAQVAAASPQQVPKVLAAWKKEADPKAAETEVERLHRTAGPASVEGLVGNAPPPRPLGP